MAGEGFKIADGFVEIHGELDRSDLERTVRAGVGAISRAARTVNLLGDLDRASLSSQLRSTLDRLPRAARRVELLSRLDATQMTGVVQRAVARIPRAARTLSLLVDIDAADLARKVETAIRLIPPAARKITLNIDLDIGATLAQLMLLRTLLSGLGRLGDGTSDLTRGFTALGTSLASMANPVGLVIAGLTAIATTSLSLIGTLTLLAPLIYTVTGLLGASMTVMVGAAGASATLALGLRGVGDAIKQMVTEGKVADDVLKKLAPSARAFVLALAPVKGLLDVIGKQLQERLFAGMAREVTILIDRLGPLVPFLSLIADGLNSIGVRIVRTFSETRNVEMMASIFEGMSRFLVRIGDLIPMVFRSLFVIGEAAIPVLDMIGDGLVKIVGRFNQWLEDAQKSGDLQAFFVDAAKAMKDLFHIGGLVVTILGQVVEILFPKSKQTSDSIFSGLRDGLQSISDWLEKPENQDKIRRFLDAVMSGFEWLQREGIPKVKELIYTAEEWATKIDRVRQTAVSVASAIAGVPESIGSFVEGVEIKVNDLLTTVGRVPEQLGSVVEGIETWVGGIPEKLGGAFDGVEQQVTGTVSSIAAEVAKLPGLVMAGLAALPGILWSGIVTAFDGATYAAGFALGKLVQLVALQPMLIAQALMALPGVVANAVTTAWNLAVDYTRSSINTVVTEVSLMPGRITGGLQAFWSLVTSTFNTTTTAAISTAQNLVNGVIDFFSQLPGRAAGAVSSLWASIAGAFFGAKDQATGQAHQTTESVTDALRALPGRAASALSGFAGSVAGALSGAVSTAYGIGRDIVAGIANGISSATGFVVDAARRAAGNAIRGFKDALGISSPSKVMAEEVGRWIPAGIAEGIASGWGSVTAEMMARHAEIISAAQELAAAARSGQWIWEDISFEGMSANYLKNLDLMRGFYDISGPLIDWGPGTRENLPRIAEWAESLAHWHRTVPPPTAAPNPATGTGPMGATVVHQNFERGSIVLDASKFRDLRQLTDFLASFSTQARAQTAGAA